MLQPLLHILNSKRIILASSSARRKQILEKVGLNFDVIPPEFAENLDKNQFQTPYDYALATASMKGLDVASRLKQQMVQVDLIISCDTVVSYCGDIFEKPTDKDDALQMLSRLSGHTHTVYSGVVLIQSVEPEPTSGSPRPCLVNKFYEATMVVIPPLSEEIITSYIATDEPLDKAGAYGIQGIGGSLIEAIHGDYYNVMGFPLHRFCKEIGKMYVGESRNQEEVVHKRDVYYSKMEM